ncbi:MAG: hypothetical protein EXS31_15775 [Pedosphaera sp.]|nr:hypothetical protein [Pedosphaera sp.]
MSIGVHRWLNYFAFSWVGKSAWPGFDVGVSDSKRRTNQPAVPQVLPETWKALLAAADDFNRLAPWVWMHDSYIVGLRHPVTQEVLLASILGRLRTLFALLVYRRAAGHRWLLNTILNDGDSGGLEREDSAYEQDAIKVEFTPKRVLWKEDRALMAAAGYAPTVKRGNGWPLFRSLVPGGFPWHITQIEAETLLFALPRVAAVARLVREYPEVWESRLDGDVAFLPDDFDPAAAELSGEQLDWHPMIPPPGPPPDLVSFDEPTLTRLHKLTHAKGFHLEVDLGYSTMAVADVDRPRFPKLALAVDRASGFIGGLLLSEITDRDGAATLGIVLLNALTQSGHRPETIRVQRSRVAAMLSGVAKELDIPVHLDVELAELNAARQSIEHDFNRRR